MNNYLLNCLIVITLFSIFKNMSYMAILNHIMVKYLSHSPKFLVMRWLLREITTSFTHLSLSHTRHKKSYAALYDTGDM